MANMTFKANLLPNSNLGYNLGSSDQKWNVYGDLTGNASTATALTSNAGSSTIPIYFSSGKPVQCFTTLEVSITGNAATATKTTQDADGKDIRDRYIRIYNTGILGNSNSVTVNDLATQGTAYGMINGAADNPRGSTGWSHVLNMSWGRNAANWNGQIALDAESGSWIKYRATSGAIAGKAWKTLLDSSNYTSYTVTKTGSGASGTWGINITGSANSATNAEHLNARSTTSWSSGLVYASGQFNLGSGAGQAYEGTSSNYQTWSFPSGWTAKNDTVANVQVLRMYWGSTYWHDLFVSPNNQAIHYRAVMNGSAYAWHKLWMAGDAVTGAVWNDYAEYREAETIEPGYILCEKGDGSLYKSTKRCQEFAGVSSDTWGFAQGETEKAKTPIAVSGRVLVYIKDKVKVNDYICSGPDGIGLKMHWWEKILYPHRIVGIVSEIPTYEKWGGGDGADRDPVDVNGRIWIKCCN